MSIGERAFGYCKALKSVTIPNSVTSIDDGAFSDCTSLTSIIIPNSVTSIGDGAFGYCKALESITIPNGVTSIGYTAFYNCTALKSVTIPNSVTSIGNEAFYSCTSLESINIPDSVNSIGNGAFAYTSLKSVTIPDSVTDIGAYAFSNCTSLESITIPNSVTDIGAYAFSNCTSLKNIIFGENSQLTYIDDEVFSNCTSLTSVTIPESVDYIYDGAFDGCSNLSTIYGFSDSTAQDYAKKKGITFVAINGTYTDDNSNISWLYSPDTKTLTITGTGAIPDFFDLDSNVKSNTKNIIIGEGITSIGDCAFEQCTSLSKVTFEEDSKLTSIGDGAFAYCEKLESITIPDSVTSIGDWAFSNCTLLKTINVDKLQSECENFSFPDGVTVNYAFALTNNLENITSDNSATKISLTNTLDYTATLTADEGYTLPESITVKVGDTTLTGGYTFEDGVLTILAENLTDDITIEATATLNEYSVTSNLTNIKTSNEETKINHGTEYQTTLTADVGYTLPKDVTIKVGDTTLTDGYSFEDGVLTIDSTKVTGNITIEATAKLNEYTVTSNLTNIKTSNEETKINHGTEYQTTLTADEGYTLPKDVTIKVGDTTLTKGYTFVDGVLTIDAKKVTGNISITATAEKQFTSSDLLKLKKHILGISKIDDISSLDVNQDNQINILDFLTIKNIILNQ